MRTKHYRWPTILLAALIGGGIVACEQDDDWEHPNRQRYAAPPEAQGDSLSIEELQRSWRARDEQVTQDEQTTRSAQSQPDQQRPVVPEGQTATNDVFDVALEYVESTVQTIVSNALEPADQQKAVGGGPTPAATPPADSRAGEM